FHVTGVQTCALPIYRIWPYFVGFKAPRRLATSRDRRGAFACRGAIDCMPGLMAVSSSDPILLLCGSHTIVRHWRHERPLRMTSLIHSSRERRIPYVLDTRTRDISRRRSVASH